MQPIIEVRNLSKQYTLGEASAVYGNLREMVVNGIKSPWRALRHRLAAEPAPSKSKSFLALNNLSLDIQKGDSVAVLGSNGAGKSTLLKIMSRITEPTSGSVRVRGRIASLLEVGTGFHPELTGRENIFLNGAILGMRKSEIEARFEDIVEFAGIGEFLDTPVKRYSSGMYVRLAFSIAAHIDPEILIVDEVLAVGDVAFQRKCLGRMAQVCTESKTVLFVSHNLAAVESLCNKGIVLNKGSLCFSGTAREAIRYYLENLTYAGDAETASVVDLRSAPGRLDKFRPQITKLELLNDDGTPLHGGVPVGSPLRAVLHVDLDRPFTSIDACVAFDTLAGQRICQAHSAYEPTRAYSRTVGKHTFICDIPKLPLLPGEYKVSVGLDVSNTEVDWVDSATRLEVLRADYYGTGVLPIKGVFLLDNRWQVVGAPGVTEDTATLVGGV